MSRRLRRILAVVCLLTLLFLIPNLLHYRPHRPSAPHPLLTDYYNYVGFNSLETIVAKSDAIYIVNVKSTTTTPRGNCIGHAEFIDLPWEGLFDSPSKLWLDFSVKEIIKGPKTSRIGTFENSQFFKSNAGYVQSDFLLFLDKAGNARVIYLGQQTENETPGDSKRRYQYVTTDHHLIESNTELLRELQRCTPKNAAAYGAIPVFIPNMVLNRERQSEKFLQAHYRGEWDTRICTGSISLSPSTRASNPSPLNGSSPPILIAASPPSARSPTFHRKKTPTPSAPF